MKAERLRALVLENWGLKLLSLAFATLLWMFVVGEKRAEVTLSVPLELVRVPEDRVIVSPVPEAIRVRLNGPRTLLATVDPQKLTVSLDLQDIRPGISAFEILPSRLNLPRGIDVTYISPSVVTLEADRKVRRVLPVKARIRGAPAEGFEVAAVDVEPAEVEVEGAERVLRGLGEIPTAVVDVTGLDGSFSRPVSLVMPDPTVKPVGDETVRLTVEIREVVAEREFLEIPVPPPAPGWTTLPATVTVRLRGSVRRLAKIASDQVRVRLEPAEEPAPGPARVLADVPPGVDVVAVEPGVVELVPPPPQEGAGEGTGG